MKMTSLPEQELYTKIYSKGTFALDYQEYADYFIKRVDPFFDFRHKRLLDAGCGTGVLAAILKKRFQTDVYGIDTNAVGVKQAKRSGVKAVVGNLEEKWPVEGNFFDAIVSIQVIEHLVNTDIFLSEGHRVLKKDGIIILTTPNLASWFNRVIFLFGFQPFSLEVSTIDKTLGLKFTRKLTPHREPLGHVRGFTLAALKDLMELHKFEVVKSLGGVVNYLPPYMSMVDGIVANSVPSLAADLIVVGRKV